MEVVSLVAFIILIFVSLEQNSRIKELEERVDELPDKWDYEKMKHEMKRAISLVTEEVKSCLSKTQDIHSKMFAPNDRKISAPQLQMKFSVVSVGEEELGAKHDEEYYHFDKIIKIRPLKKVDNNELFKMIEKSIELGDIHSHSKDGSMCLKKNTSNFFKENFVATISPKKKNEGYKKRTRDANGRFI